uniref:Uncharacterized protein n=1 Tax=Pygoscelis antarcticus TaxID=79643 RepID=A0A7G7LKG6_PYGAN|nr:hypothetical protein [Pygoscelis antarcticus]
MSERMHEVFLCTYSDINQLTRCRLFTRNAYKYSPLQIVEQYYDEAVYIGRLRAIETLGYPLRINNHLALQTIPSPNQVIRSLEYDYDLGHMVKLLQVLGADKGLIKEWIENAE